MEAYEYMSKVYDELMLDVEYAKWASYLDGFLKNENVNSVFETGCGTGNMTFELYRLGYDITASDISAGMLRVAAQRAKANAYDITFVLQDMRRIEVGNKVDAAVSACDAVNYINGDGLALFAQSSYTALKEEGLLLFDISSRHKLERMDGEVFFDDGEDASCIWQNTYDGKRNTLTMDVTLFVRKGKLFERFTEQHTQYAHEEEFVFETLYSAGFKHVRAFECFTDRAVSVKTQRIQFVAAKHS